MVCVRSAWYGLHFCFSARLQLLYAKLNVKQRDFSVVSPLFGLLKSRECVSCFNDDRYSGPTIRVLEPKTRVVNRGSAEHVACRERQEKAESFFEANELI